MTVAAINTAAIALFILGGLGYAYMMLVVRLNSLAPQFEMRFTVHDGATKDQIHDLAVALRKQDGVARAVFLPKDVEWEKWRKRQDILDDTTDIENPLPNQFLIVLSDLKKADVVKAAIRKQAIFVEQDDIRDATAERERITTLMDFVGWAGIVLGTITVFTATTLILNAVYLTVLARRQEIKIMRLMGASHSMIRWPFLLEGGVQGLLGGVLAGLLLWALAAYLAARPLQAFASQPAQAFPALRILLFLCALGALMGMASAALSTRKYLKVQG